MVSKSVAVIPGDDAAPEAMQASLRVLQGMDLPVTWDLLPTGEELRNLDPAERETMVNSRIDAADTALFGSSNGTTPGIVHMRWGRKTFANVRPVQWRPGFGSPMANPEGIDYVIVRENLEDAYIGVMGDLADLRRTGLVDDKPRMPAGDDGRYAVKVITREGTEQVARFACELARSRRGKLTVSAKTNMLPATDRWFCRLTRDIAEREFPDIEFEEFIVDDMAHRLVVNPHDLDVLLLPNLYGDILSDLGAGTVGGLGLAPSGCFGDDFAYFESAHGTAPDIAGQGIINPTATMLSAAMMLRHLGLDPAADRLDRAIGEVYEGDGSVLTPDQGGGGTTEGFADAVLERMQP